jgi:hypothetical protein
MSETALASTPVPGSGVLVTSGGEVLVNMTVSANGKSADAIKAELSRPFDPDEIKCKPQAVKGTRALVTFYIDARLVEDRLDEVVGVSGWKEDYQALPEGAVVCRLSILFGNEWVTKMDVGSPSEQPDGGDRMKAAFSDALKRAAVKFGIGRYLYRIPNVWHDYDPAKKQFIGRPIPGGPAAPAPRPAAAKPAAQPSAAANLPRDGKELLRRVAEYESKLVAQKVCVANALVHFLSQAGDAAGFGHDLETWAGPAIPFSVEKVKEFEKLARTANAAPPAAEKPKKTAAPSQMPATVPELVARLAAHGQKLTAEGIVSGAELFGAVTAWGKENKLPPMLDDWPAFAIIPCVEFVKKWLNERYAAKKKPATSAPAPAAEKPATGDAIGDREAAEIEWERRDDLEADLYRLAGELGKDAQSLINAHRAAIDLAPSATPKTFGKLTLKQLEALQRVLRGLSETPTDSIDVPY